MDDALGTEFSRLFDGRFLGILDSAGTFGMGQFDRH
jgi:hypothetical protein